MIERHPFYHPHNPQFGVFDCYPPKSYIFAHTGSGLRAKACCETEYEDIITLRFATRFDVIEKKVLMNRETNEPYESSHTSTGTNQSNEHIGVLIESETGKCTYTLITAKDMDGNGEKQKQFDSIDTLVRTLFPDLGAGILSSKISKGLSGLTHGDQVVENDPAFHLENSADVKVQKGEVNSYIWRTSSLDNPNSSVRHYVLVYKKIIRGKDVVIKGLFQVEKFIYAIPSREIPETKIFTRFTNFYLENGKLCDTKNDFYSTNQVVKSLMGSPTPILRDPSKNSVI